MSIKEDLAKVSQQIGIEKKTAQEQLKVRQDKAQRDADKKKEREAKFKELGITDLFRAIAGEGVVAGGSVNENNSDFDSSAFLKFNHQQGGFNFDDSYDQVSAQLSGEWLEIEGNYRYKTQHATRLDGGEFLWIKTKRVLHGYEETERFLATIPEIIGKVISDPERSGGGYNNY